MALDYDRSCKVCGALLRFERSQKTGKMVPINVASGQNHFTDCPGVDSFRKSRPKPESAS